MIDDLQFDLSPTQYQFAVSDAHICMLVGPMGEGKTFAGTVALIVHAARCGIPIFGALIRDTHTNIRKSTAKDMKAYLGEHIQFRDQEREATIKTDPPVHLDLFGIDDQASLSKLQGPQYSIIWLEEPAPIYERANAGLPKEVFMMAIARAARQTGTKMRVQITQNPADENHWTAKVAEEPDEYLTAEDGTVIYKKLFRIPRGENTHLSPIARAANMAAFKDDPGKWSRYVEGVEAAVHMGKKVTTSYNPRIHFSDKILPVLKGEALMFWDGWMNPTCILAQYRQVGNLGEARQLVIHDVLYDEGIGTKELIREQVQPMMASPKWKNKVSPEGWRAILDPSMATSDQSSSRSSARREIENSFGCRCELGPDRWEVRRETVNEPFKTLIADGIPTVILSRTAVRLHRALKGGWHYKTDNNGNVIGNKPVQTDEHSHPGNAWSYGAAILFPYNPIQRIKNQDKENRARRVLSYGGQHWRQKPSGIYAPERQSGVVILPGKNIAKNK